ncbi:FecCD family ABC transporter permease [Paenibacillus prosopidis]|uniref:Iron complex transport system permease protein n=1 Tax=Paenibacillus prosopidis TaxID=630520 RepID=A0A368VKM7_9BACL|nr:iron ABC transporter permease [Paenibacillus prosopidis]RCW42259.1 iron complex transport system permease protein [Paenibacillus prosopidis]
MKHFSPLRPGKLPVSIFLHRKTFLITVALILANLAVLIISTGLGDMNISPIDVLKTIFGRGTDDHTIVIHTLRLPRIIAAFLVGASLAAAGAILQGVIRNPLASPDIIGITSGASVAAVAFITYFSEVSIKWLPVAAMVGAGITSMIIYSMAWKKGVTPIRLVLIGIGMNFLLVSLTKVMLVLSPIYSSSEAYIWLTGTVYGTSWEMVWALLPWTVFFIPLAMVNARNVNVLQLGDDVAAGVGSAVQRQRFVLMWISVALAGSAVAVGGGIAFIGLIAPHMTRRMVGPSFGGVLPVSALIGGLIVVVADLIARTAFIPYDIPVGVFTAGVGAPFFIYLLYRNRNSRS